MKRAGIKETPFSDDDSILPDELWAHIILLVLDYRLSPSLEDNILTPITTLSRRFYRIGTNHILPGIKKLDRQVLYIRESKEKFLQFHSLESLALVCNSQLVDEDVCSFKQLTSLNLSFNASITDKALERLT